MRESTRFEHVENEHLDFFSQQLVNKVRINVGFINRHIDSIFPQIDDAAEDVERSARSRRAVAALRSSAVAASDPTFASASALCSGPASAASGTAASASEPLARCVSEDGSED